MMKTSNKLLIVVYLIVLGLITSSFLLSKNEIRENRSNISLKEISLDYRIDSLVILSPSNLNIIKGDTLTIKYYTKKEPIYEKRGILYI